MDLVKTNCKTCGIPLLNLEVCYKCSDRAATLRAHYDAVYMAEVGSGSGLGTAHTNALESVRTHAARMQERERVIEEVANG